MKEKSAENIKNAFAFALTVGGIENAEENIDTLMTKDKGETFAKYYPRNSAFDKFRTQFGMARFDVVKACGWTDSSNMDLLQIDPQHKQEIVEYYDKVFYPAVLNTKASGGTNES